MQAAISTQSSKMNLPCCARYVLHVSQIMLETLLIALWTGSARQRANSQQPTSAPTAQMASPRYNRAVPLKPTPGNFTCVRSGRLISASPAKALAAPNSVASTIPDRSSDLLFCIF